MAKRKRAQVKAVDADARRSVPLPYLPAAMQALQKRAEADATLWQPLGARKQDATDEWSRPDYPSQWAMLFHCSVDTLKRRIEKGTLRVTKITAKQWRVHKGDLPQPAK